MNANGFSSIRKQILKNKKMKKDQIRINAEKICKRLESNLTDTNIYKLKRDCKLNLLELCTALGWLAKEEKITFVNYDNKAIYVFPAE